jgi:hypothetical protein
MDRRRVITRNIGFNWVSRVTGAPAGLLVAPFLVNVHHRAVAALGVCRPDGTRNDRSWVAAERQAAAAELRGRRWAKGPRMRLDPRTLTFPDRRHHNTLLKLVEVTHATCRGP